VGGCSSFIGLAIIGGRVFQFYRSGLLLVGRCSSFIGPAFTGGEVFQFYGSGFYWWEGVPPICRSSHNSELMMSFVILLPVPVTYEF